MAEHRMQLMLTAGDEDDDGEMVNCLSYDADWTAVKPPDEQLDHLPAYLMSASRTLHIHTASRPLSRECVCVCVCVSLCVCVGVMWTSWNEWSRTCLWMDILRLPCSHIVTSAQVSANIRPYSVTHFHERVSIFVTHL